MRESLLLSALAAMTACGPTATKPVPSGEPIVVDHDTEPPPLASSPLSVSRDQGTPFFQAARYEASVPSPETCLGGQVLGSSLAPPERIVDCFRQWAAASSRVQVERYALSFEGRELVRAVISSPANLARLGEIQSDLAKLADPRGLAASDAQRIVDDSPAVAWFGYSIHGDEVSGADASLAFGYHLIASQDPGVRAMLDQVVVVIDPVMNPDGRARIMSQITQSGSRVTNLDFSSMHRGRWPWGRGNHYLFDMNRDWLVGAAPETRGRWRELQRFNPQLVIDAHEMGPQQTYLFYPYAAPVNREFPSTLARWHQVFARDHAQAFDRYGWAYYTREWADGWYPGYTDAWNALHGAIGILYEQASTKGLSMRRADGRTVTYRETVHAQAVSSLANLTTFSRHRKEVLRDFLAHRQAQVDATGKQRTFVVRPGRHPDRERHFLQTLLRQGVEVYRADADFSARGVESVLGEKPADTKLPKGVWLVPGNQPKGALVRAMLQFDVRLDKDFLVRERAELERKQSSRIYDVTAWNLGQAFALDAFWIDAPAVAMSQVTELPAATVGVQGKNVPGAYAWVVDGRDDRSLSFAVQALEQELVVHVADERFSSKGRWYPRGSLLIRRGENPRDAGARVDAAARAAEVAAIPVHTGRSATTGPDLGGTHFHRLTRPRIAIVGNWPVRPTGFGHIWYQLDQVLGVSVTLLDAQSLGFYDLRRYNVIVLPPASGQLSTLLAPHKSSLAAWVRGGGTLVAVGRSATHIANADLGLSQVRLRRHVLKELPAYQATAKRQLASRSISVDEAALWADGTATEAGATTAAGGSQSSSGNGGGGKRGGGKRAGTPVSPEPVSPESDRWQRRFSPSGVFLRGLVDTDSWLTFGYGDEVPVFASGSHALMAKGSARTAVRLAPRARLRLSGLLWPEAAERLQLSSYATVESMGAGQVVLFASPPSHRAHYIGTARMLANALIYGPSLGARQPLVW